MTARLTAGLTTGPRRWRTRWADLARTATRALPWLLLTFGLMAFAGDRYRLAINDQVQKCLPPYSLFLVDRHDRRIGRGTIVALPAGARMAAYFPPTLTVVKRVVGLPGDRIEVTARDTRVNGMVVGEGLDLAPMLGRDPASFARGLTLPEGYVWIMGDTRDSFDARYWGARPISDLIGRAYPLW